MISHFHKLGYIPIVGDTDGFNFKLPETYRYTESNPYIIEDAAESLGANYKGVQTGSFGEYAAISFNGNKTIA